MLFAIILAFVLHSNAQCGIDGLGTILEDTESTYTTNSVAGANYFWSSTEDIVIVSSNDSESVDISTIGTEGGQLCLTVFQDGEEPCCNCIDIIVETEPDCIPATGIQITEIEISGNGCPGDNITFTATVQPSDASQGSYHWQAGIGFIGSNIFVDEKGESSIVIPTPAGDYQAIWVRVTFTSCDNTTVTALTPIIWENNCFKNGEIWKVGLSQNPFNNETQFIVDAKDDVEGLINIFNSQGDLVYTKNNHFNSGENIIDIVGIPEKVNGLLYFQISTQSNIVATGTLVKQQ